MAAGLSQTVAIKRTRARDAVDAPLGLRYRPPGAHEAAPTRSAAMRDRQQVPVPRLLRVTLADTGGLHRAVLRLPRRLDDVAVWVAALDADVVRLVPLFDELDTIGGEAVA
jgi:hypothetical protein